MKTLMEKKTKKIQSKNSIVTNSYLNFLVISENNLLKSNKITIKYLNTPAEKRTKTK